MLAAGLSLSITTMSANAEVGYLDYQKVLENYPAAQQAVAKEIDAKGFRITAIYGRKEKQYKSLDTPLKKQNFENSNSNRT